MQVALSPVQVVEKQRNRDIPQWVIDVVNQLLVENFRNGRAVIVQDELIEAMIAAAPNIRRVEIFERNLLDFEHIFEEAGWVVEYHNRWEASNYFVFTVK